MTADRPTARGDGLLYIPDDDLVRSTVDGPDADWADARSYVPSDVLISQVLHESYRETARFKFPDSCMLPAPRTARGPLRAASAVFAAMHLSPSTLAAATAVHVAAFLILSPLSIGGGRVPALRPSSMTLVQLVQPPRLIYFAPQATEAAPPATRRPTVEVKWSGFRVTNQDSLTVRSSPTRGEASAVVDSGGYFENRRGRAGEDREVAAALDQEFQLGGDPLRVEQSDRGRLVELARVLTLRPRVRLNVLGVGPSLPDGRPNQNREVEAFLRELIALGVPRDQIDLVSTVSEQPCPEREPFCARGRSRVKTSMAPRRP